MPRDFAADTPPSDELVLVAAATEAAALGLTSGGAVRVRVAGVGRAGDPAAFEAIDAIDAGRGHVLNLGLSGCLDGSLPAGAVAVIRRWLPSPPPDGPGHPGDRADAYGAGASPAIPDEVVSALVARLERGGIAATPVAAVTVDAPLHAPPTRASLASAGATLVDMESGVWARHAARRGVSFVSIRVVSDAADNELPLPRHLLLRIDGSLRRIVWLRALAGQPPWRWWELWRRLRQARRDWRAAMASMRALGAWLVAPRSDQNRSVR